MFEAFATWLLKDVLGMDVTTKLGSAAHFFVYDTLKILVLLTIMIFIISYIRSYFPAEKVKQWIQGRNQIAAYGLAALLGILSPFCSCSTVPLFIGFIGAGIPLGIVFTFLITSPIVNEISLVLLFSIFGWKLAILYTFAGVTIAIVSGVLISKLKMEKHVESYVYELKMGETAAEEDLSVRSRMVFAVDNVKDTVKRIWIYLVIGIGIGALIHGYAPEDLLTQYAGQENWFAVPIATLLAVPLYSNAIGSLPIIEALIQKGVAVGTALSFMMAITALSLPEIILLRKVIKVKLIALFVAIVAGGIIIMGYLFNFIL